MRLLEITEESEAVLDTVINIDSVPAIGVEEIIEEYDAEIVCAVEATDSAVPAGLEVNAVVLVIQFVRETTVDGLDVTVEETVTEGEYDSDGLLVSESDCRALID